MDRKVPGATVGVIKDYHGYYDTPKPTFLTCEGIRDLGAERLFSRAVTLVSGGVMTSGQPYSPDLQISNLSGAALVDTQKVVIGGIMYWISKADYDTLISSCSGCCI